MVYNVALYVLYFFFYSALGWLIESIYCSVPAKKWINRGFLTGPMCPIYGTGAVSLALVLTPIRDKPLLACLLGMIITDIVEFITSVLMEKLFHARWWDYSDRKFNIQGRVCLRNTLLWGIATFAFLYIIHPAVVTMFSFIPPLYVYILLGLVLAVFAVDLFNAFRNAMDIRKFMDKLRHLSDTLSAKYEGLSKRAGRFFNSVSEIDAELDDTRHVFSDITQRHKKKGLRQPDRLFRGFPKLETDARSQMEKLEEKLRNLKRRIMEDGQERY